MIKLLSNYNSQSNHSIPLIQNWYTYIANMLNNSNRNNDNNNNNNDDDDEKNKESKNSEMFCEHQINLDTCTLEMLFY